MAKNKPTASTKKPSTPPKTPTPPIPDQDNQGEQTSQTPPVPPIDNPTSPAVGKDKFTVKCQEVTARYAVSYPTCKAFHFCSDMQVFLDADLKEARAHQAELDGGKIVTIKIN